MPPVSDNTWARTLDYVRVHHHSLVREWFDRLQPAGLTNGVLEVTAADATQQRYLTETCRPAFVEAAQAATGRLVTVAFTLGAGIPPLAAIEFDESEAELQLNPDYQFEHFVTGPCNRMAHAASVAISDSPGQTYNPLFIHGDVGLGKSHLLQAVCHKLRHAQLAHNVLYLSCEAFANHFFKAVECGALHRFRFRYRHVDVLAIDDIQMLAARERSQEEFFHTFNTLYQSRKQLILTSDSAPREIPSLEERLVSRFNWGLVTRIDPPCLETRMAILRMKAKLKCIELPEDVTEHIASKVQANTRELEGALLRVHALSQEHGGRIDLTISAEALDDSPVQPSRRISLEDIVDHVTSHYHVKASELRGRKRSRSIALPRQVCMYLARQLTSLSLEEIGNSLGGRDHTTVLHASRTIANQRQGSEELERSLTEIANTLRRR